MDSLTHIAIGACIGELIAGKQIGKKAMILGAIAQSLPDIDIVATFFCTPSGDLLAHRGFTHSLLFVVIFAPILGFFSKKTFVSGNVNINKWIYFWGLQLLIHLFIDCFNVYGTGLFEPFSHYRVSFNTLFVLDPLFVIWPVIAFCLLLILNISHKRRKQIIYTGLSLSAIYLTYSIIIKLIVGNEVKSILQKQQIKTNRIFTTATSLNNLLWFVVGECDSGYYLGYHSVLDKTDSIAFHFANRNDSLLSDCKLTQEIADLKRFSQGYYVISKKGDTTLFHDLRFGEVAGWDNPHPRFVFYYYLQPNADNSMIIQRGRVAKWDKPMIESFLKRIKGI